MYADVAAARTLVVSEKTSHGKCICLGKYSEEDEGHSVLLKELGEDCSKLVPNIT